MRSIDSDDNTYDDRVQHTHTHRLMILMYALLSVPYVRCVSLQSLIVHVSIEIGPYYEYCLPPRLMLGRLLARFVCFESLATVGDSHITTSSTADYTS